jgi:hypothetical protein
MKFIIASIACIAVSGCGSSAGGTNGDAANTSSVEAACRAQCAVADVCPQHYGSACVTNCEAPVSPQNSVPGCDAQYAAYVTCSADPTLWSCAASGQPQIDIAKGAKKCGVEAGAFESCTGCQLVKCQTSADCPGDQACNSATRACFKFDAICVGLPCQTGADCPSPETCNDATHACN